MVRTRNSGVSAHLDTVLLAVPPVRSMPASCFSTTDTVSSCAPAPSRHGADIADQDLPPAERARRKHEAIRQNIYRLGPYLAADSRSWRVELLLAPVALGCEILAQWGVEWGFIIALVGAERPAGRE
jgi:hypothetical protein